MAAAMTHEETVVRTAYAKLAFASEEGVIGQLAFDSIPGALVQKQYAGMTAEQRLDAVRVRFTLSDFVVGEIKGILDRKVTDVMPFTNDYQLSGSIGLDNYREPGVEAHWNHFDAAWQPSRPTPERLAMLQGITLDQSYQVDWKTPRPEKLWERYALYSVTVTFQGRTMGPYKALFIFGHDDKGHESVTPEDVSVPGLFSALSEHLFPDAFVLTHMRTYPVIQNWLNTNQVRDQSCSVGRGDICCDLTKLKCGVGSTDMAIGLAEPWPDPSSPVPPQKQTLPEWLLHSNLPQKP